jgi:hypothetical protein
MIYGIRIEDMSCIHPRGECPEGAALMNIMHRCALMILCSASSLLAACTPEAILIEAKHSPSSSSYSSHSTVAAAVPASAVAPDIEPGRQVSQGDRWNLTSAQARKDLEGTVFGEQEISEFWTRKGWRLTKKEERYIMEIEVLVKSGSAAPLSRWAQTPFSSVYQALRPLKVMGVMVQRGQEFYLDMNEHEDDLKLGSPRFRRASGYEEAHEDGHHTDPSEEK